MILTQERIKEGDIAKISLPYEIKLPFPWGKVEGMVAVYLYFDEIDYEGCKIQIEIIEED